ncbi:LysM peptidoglycan-binding domain-containing protein [Roseibacillus persicicus]|uniref:LysM domain-containing protein n=1 Tax=Roseibacillus persicicus TaxID=454148 RepID=A0A918THZ8_9BACT|nr:LysM peptidoglycan-binding domain-containing protein [Roseibacillus persicicus]GHC47049.1 hypothetical protein GCM10007100_10980 [Roseibacillus persicicus]
MNALPKLLKIALLPLLAVSLNAASTYKVQSGDTLSSIARKNGTTPSKLMSDNGITNPNMLMVGQVLKIGSGSTPKAKPTSTKPARTSSSSGNYTVKAGETLYSIARRHGMSVSQLTGLNPGLDPAKLKVGQKIVTSGSAPKPKAKTPAPAPKPVIAKTPAPAPKVSKPAPTPSPALASTQPAPKAAPTPAPQPKPLMIAEKRPETPATISSVMVSKEISFGALASQHRTSTKQLNELNGWSLKPTTILAKGSEIYVPGS